MTNITLKILLIEDDPDLHPIIQGHLQKSLQALGYRVIFDAATTIEAAAGKLLCNRYDRVVTDLSLPNTKHFEVLDLLDDNNIPEGNRIILTGDMSPMTRIASENRVGGYFTKMEFSENPQQMAEAIEPDDQSRDLLLLKSQIEDLQKRAAKAETRLETIQNTLIQLSRVQEQGRGVTRALVQDIEEWKGIVRDYRTELMNEEGTLDKLLSLQGFFSDLSPKQKFWLGFGLLFFGTFTIIVLAAQGILF